MIIFQILCWSFWNFFFTWKLEFLKFFPIAILEKFPLESLKLKKSHKTWMTLEKKKILKKFSNFIPFCSKSALKNWRNTTRIHVDPKNFTALKTEKINVSLSETCQKIWSKTTRFLFRNLWSFWNFLRHPNFEILMNSP